MSRLSLVLYVWVGWGSGAGLVDAAGEALYAPCVGCHGPRAEGNFALNAPNLAAGDAWYLERQLRGFRDGWRGGAGDLDVAGQTMRAATSGLQNDGDIAAVAAFIAALPARTPAAPPVPAYDGDLGNGRSYFNGICSACHGSNGKGNAVLQTPRLAGVDGEYLRRQFANFKSGARGSHPDDKYGRQMQKMARVLPDAETEQDVFAYIQTLAP